MESWDGHKVGAENMTHVILSVSVVSRTQAGGIVLAKQRIEGIRKQPAIRDLIKGVRERIVDVCKERRSVLLSERESHTIVICYRATLSSGHRVVIRHNRQFIHTRHS